MVQCSVQHEWGAYCSKEYGLELVHDQFTVGITEPEEAGVVSITLMKINMEKGFLYISGDGKVVYTKVEDA